MDAKLILMVKGKPRKSVSLNKPVVAIGRAQDCDVRVPLALVSRKHCTIRERDDGLLVRDEGSSNGTFVNGQRIREQVLSPGDELSVGPARFRVEFEVPAEAYGSAGDSGVVAAIVDDEEEEGEEAVAAVVDEDDEPVAAVLDDEDEEEPVAAVPEQDGDEAVAAVVDDEEDEQEAAAASDQGEQKADNGGIQLEESPEDVAFAYLEQEDAQEQDEPKPADAGSESVPETTALAAADQGDEEPTQKIDIPGDTDETEKPASAAKPSEPAPPAKPKGRTNTDLDELDDEELDSFLDSLNTLSDDEEEFEQQK